MPYFTFKGQSIGPNNTFVEVVSEDVSCTSADFFKHNGSGHVEITGVTDSGYKLITPDSNTILEELKQDVFNGHLQINDVAQKYCKKGLAPIGTELYSMNAGTYYLKWDSNDNGLKIVDSSEKLLYTIGDQSNPRYYFTIMLCGGGGGGGGGTSGLGWKGGGGGGGGAGVTATLLFDVAAMVNYGDQIGSSYYTVATIKVGSGGSGSSSGGKAGGATSFTTVFPVAEDGSVMKFVANGGGGGSKGDSSGGSKGTASITYGTYEIPQIKILLSTRVDGGAGARSKKTGGSSTSTAVDNYTVNSNHRTTLGGYSGGGGSSEGGGPGGGGASAFAKGGGAGGGGHSPGGGGSGGWGAFNTGKSGYAGSAGVCKIIY
jgi:hypothetical protein